jgi:hypothetical protein
VGDGDRVRRSQSQQRERQRRGALGAVRRGRPALDAGRARLSPAADPGSVSELLGSIERWAGATEWCRWLELAGSLGRGAGDELSDIDAGIGVDLEALSYDQARSAALAAARTFAPVSDELIQALGTEAEPRDHLIVQYGDGRQLSLVVMDARARPGLPPEARAVLDRDGTLARPWRPAVYEADAAVRREWAFLAWISLGDCARHLVRGRRWRAVAALQEARAETWKLIAAELGVGYPGFGSVSVDSAGLAPPPELEHSLPGDLRPESILAAADALARTLAPLSRELDVAGVEQATRARLRLCADVMGS